MVCFNHAILLHIIADNNNRYINTLYHYFLTEMLTGKAAFEYILYHGIMYSSGPSDNKSNTSQKLKLHTDELY